jgi:hypothetical protein
MGPINMTGVVRMEQLAELGFVDNRDSARDQPTVRDHLGAFNSPTSSLLAVAAPAATVPGEPGLRGTDRRFSSAPVTQQREGSLTASALKPRSRLANRNPLSLRTCAQVSIIAAVALLCPALVFLAAIAVEIVIGVLVDASGLALPVFAAAGAIGWLLLRKLCRRQEGAPVET